MPDTAFEILQGAEELYALVHQAMSDAVCQKYCHLLTAKMVATTYSSVLIMMLVLDFWFILISNIPYGYHTDAERLFWICAG